MCVCVEGGGGGPRPELLFWKEGAGVSQFWAPLDRPGTIALRHIGAILQRSRTRNLDREKNLVVLRPSHSHDIMQAFLLAARRVRCSFAQPGSILLTEISFFDKVL